MKNSNSLLALRHKAGRLKTKRWRRLKQRLRNFSGHTRPAFLVGCGRSGTSMLVMQLGRSWQLDVFNENNSAAFENWFLRDYEVIGRLIAESLAPIVLFKPILETYRAGQLLEQFPEARILFAFRHYYDVVNSSLKKFGVNNRVNHVDGWIRDDFEEFADLRPPVETQERIRSLWRPDLSPEEGAALYWIFQNRLFFDLGIVNNDQGRLVCYEAVVSNPVAEFSGLCEYLGVQFEPKMAAGIFDSSIHKNPPPAMEDRIQAECEALWQRLLKQAADQ